MFCVFVDDPDVFVYTNQGGSPTVSSIDDEADFASVKDAFNLMGNCLEGNCYTVEVASALLAY